MLSVILLPGSDDGISEQVDSDSFCRINMMTWTTNPHRLQFLLLVVL